MAARVAREAALRKAQRRKAIVRAGIAAVIFAALVGVFSLTRDDEGDKKAAETTAAPTTTTTLAIDPAKQYVATITTNFGVVKVELDAKNAPIATDHFVTLAREGFYDGLTWHRVGKDFMIQGGDPNGDGSGGSGSSVVGEVPTDNYPLGSIAAAKTLEDPAGTFDAQFFVVTGSQGATLSNDYARFGMVIEGLEVAQAIEALAPPGDPGAPTAPATIDSIEITESEASAEDASTSSSAGATTTTTAAATTTAAG